jgi:hypothetical protein
MLVEAASQRERPNGGGGESNPRSREFCGDGLSATCDALCRADYNCTTSGSHRTPADHCSSSDVHRPKPSRMLRATSPTACIVY